MKKRKILYAMTGLLSLLGFFGIFTEARGFLFFFFSAADFMYLFRASDEMLETWMNQAAAWAFYVGMAAVPLTALGTLLFAGFSPKEALIMALAVGWAAALVVHGVLVGVYALREERATRD